MVAERKLVINNPKKPTEKKDIKKGPAFADPSR
jgi:hypothetical protein